MLWGSGELLQRHTQRHTKADGCYQELAVKLEIEPFLVLKIPATLPHNILSYFQCHMMDSLGWTDIWAYKKGTKKPGMW